MTRTRAQYTAVTVGYTPGAVRLRGRRASERGGPWENDNCRRRSFVLLFHVNKRRRGGVRTHTRAHARRRVQTHTHTHGRRVGRRRRRRRGEVATVRKGSSALLLLYVRASSSSYPVAVPMPAPHHAARNIIIITCNTKAFSPISIFFFFLMRTHRRLKTNAASTGNNALAAENFVLSYVSPRPYPAGGRQLPPFDDNITIGVWANFVHDITRSLVASPTTVNDSNHLNNHNSKCQNETFENRDWL